MLNMFHRKDTVTLFVDRSILQHEKCLVPNLMTHLYCCTKDESHPYFHQSVAQLTTVKLDFIEFAQ